jgi:hypothetical protein
VFLFSTEFYAAVFLSSANRSGKIRLCARFETLKAVTRNPGLIAHILIQSMISGFRRVVDEICALLERYSASSGNPSPTFRDNVSVSSSRVKKSLDPWPLKMGPIRSPETSVKYYNSTLRNTPEERRSKSDTNLRTFPWNTLSSHHMASNPRI